jgi:exopolyphosphatase/guanosine-5'-triphosphate,3'-diphosphate pyrophosphatase
VLECLKEARIPRLRPDEMLVGTGGSCRNLAKVDRRPRVYPVTRLHGYRLSRNRVAELATLLAAKRESRRGRVPGLSRERGDSIAGGGVGMLALLDHLGADEILVAGQGVREGAAYSLMERGTSSAARGRERSLRALCERFATWGAGRAERRVRLVETLATRVAIPSAAVRQLLGPAAQLLDIGVSVDYFDRHEHAADIVLATDLEGFTHHQVALLSAIVRAACEDPEPFSYGPLIAATEKADVKRAGVLVALADDIEERCVPGRRPDVHLRVSNGTLRVLVGGLLGWRPRALETRFARAFGLTLRVERA